MKILRYFNKAIFDQTEEMIDTVLSSPKMKKNFLKFIDKTKINSEDIEKKNIKTSK